MFVSASLNHISKKNFKELKTCVGKHSWNFTATGATAASVQNTSILFPCSHRSFHPFTHASVHSIDVIEELKLNSFEFKKKYKLFRIWLNGCRPFQNKSWDCRDWWRLAEVNMYRLIWINMIFKICLQHRHGNDRSPKSGDENGTVGTKKGQRFRSKANQPFLSSLI